MASKKKKGAILRCTNLTFQGKEPSKENINKSATLSITFETASGSWTQKKVFEEVWRFAETSMKQHKRDKAIGRLQANSSKYKDEYLKKHKADNAFKLLKDLFNAVGKNKKILTSDSKITSFIGAKREHATDIKNAQKITKKLKTKTSTVGAAAFMGDSAPKSRKKVEKESVADHDDDDDDDDADDEHGDTAQESTSKVKEASPQVNEVHYYKQQAIELKQDIDKVKRKHLADISALKQDNHNLTINNNTLKETNAASQEARQELEEKCLKYEHELGRDQIDDGIAAIFADEFKKEADPAEKYYQQTKEQKERILVLEDQVQSLSHENGTLRQKLERAKYVADHLATEVTELADPKYEQLEQDYKEVEAELDEVNIIKEEYEEQIQQTAIILDQLELENAKMKPIFNEYPNIMNKSEKERKDMTTMQEKMSKLQEERDEFEDRFLDIKKKDVVPMEQYKSTVKSYQERIKEADAKAQQIETEKQEAIKEMEQIKGEMGEIKIKIGQLEADNDRLEQGGGRDINLDISLDLENDFSIFKKDEFEYPENVSRDQLILWCQHFKLLIREINDELCSEINTLSERNETLETYIEHKGLPFPEDDEEFNKNKNEIEKILRINDLPHPLPSMNFMDDLDEYNPTKKQLMDYVDLMFAEWRRDEADSNKMLLRTKDNMDLLKELDAYDLEQGEEEVKSNEHGGGGSDERENAEVKKLKKQLEKAYLKEEETKLEHKKSTKELKEENESLQTQLKTEQQKNKVQKDPAETTGTLATKDIEQEQKSMEEDEQEQQRESLVIDDELVLLKNRLMDSEQYVKELEDDLKQLKFESNQQQQIVERENGYQIETINIDLEESRTQCEDLERQIGSDDLNLLASEFRTELWDARADNNELKKKHIQEIRQLERDRDELLREINLLRIKTDRMDQNTDEAVAKMQVELDKKEKELEHSMQVVGNLSQVKESMDTLVADKEELERSYQHLLKEREQEKQMYIKDIQQLNIEKKKLIIRIQTAEQDIKALKSGQGIDSDAIITRTELVKMKEEMDNLRQKRGEAVKSKIMLLRTSSMEIERMRDEIRLLTGHRKVSMRDFRPGRYDSTSFNMDGRYSVSSLGSVVPGSGAPHQQLLGNDEENNAGYVGSAWNYTVGMLSSISTSVFGTGSNNKQTDRTRDRDRDRDRDMDRRQHRTYHEEDVYDVHSEYDRDGSRRSSVSRYGPQQQPYRMDTSRSLSYPRQPATHQKKPSRHMPQRKKMNRYQSMGYGGVESGMAVSSNIDSEYVQHSRGLSTAALRAKRNRGDRDKGMHRKHLSRHSSRPHGRNYSNISAQSQSASMKRTHRSKEPSKQEILLESEENENIRDAMANILDAFDIAQDNVNKSSMDITRGVGGDNLAMFTLDDIVKNDNDHDRQESLSMAGMAMGQKLSQRKSAPRDKDYNGNNMMSGDYFEHVINNSTGNDDFWNTNNQDEDENINQMEYSDDDRFGMAAMDFSGDAALHGL